MHEAKQSGVNFGFSKGTYFTIGNYVFLKILWILWMSSKYQNAKNN